VEERDQFGNSLKDDTGGRDKPTRRVGCRLQKSPYFALRRRRKKRRQGIRRGDKPDCRGLLGDLGKEENSGERG